MTGRELTVLGSRERARQRQAQALRLGEPNVERRRRKDVRPVLVGRNRRAERRHGVDAKLVALEARATDEPNPIGDADLGHRDTPALSRSARAVRAALAQRRKVEHAHRGLRESAIEQLLRRQCAHAIRAIPAALMLNARESASRSVDR